MKVLITGVCGFVGSTIARLWREQRSGLEIIGVDNFMRPGSELNRASLKDLGVHVSHADIRQASDFEQLPDVDWVIDAAANPSVLAGIDGRTSSRQLVEHNLVGTINMLEYCRRAGAGFVLLSTSRVYSIPPLSSLPVTVVGDAYALAAATNIAGLSSRGVSESFSTEPPVSIYGATKLASEQLALEYGAAYDFPVWINRCGVLAGSGQFGRADQGIFSFWIHSWKARAPLTYLGFDGQGHQVRDCLHPADLVPILDRQLAASATAPQPRVQNVSGGAASARSLRQISGWCAQRFGPHQVTSRAETRPFDVPWMVLDASRAAASWDWTPAISVEAIFEEIAVHAERNPGWLEMSR
ncbi:MAG TPA: NAD-dependent epimerase/dehydratase family protein [Vicinamibacterales bacterium]|nr:NAD-dependent epimerase/dehydratase family protein [Vicinamibacterales bacterium]